MKALLIPVDGTPREVDLPGGGTRFMRSLKALIGTKHAERIQVFDMPGLTTMPPAATNDWKSAAHPGCVVTLPGVTAR